MRWPHILICLSESLVAVDQLSTITLDRCRRALLAWQNGKYDYLVVSGGMFLSPGIQTRPIAQVMAEWFIAKGVPLEKIFIEDQSRDTFENIKYTIELLERKLFRRHCYHLTVCTQFQHALRARITLWGMYRLSAEMIPAFQPTMSWWDWWKEWFLLIPYHLFDPTGTGEIALRNRAARTAATRGESE